MEGYCDSLTLIKQGAEAKIYEGVFVGRAVMVKQRFRKTYRLPEIDDKLTKKRLTQEVKSLQRCRKIGIRTPAIYFVDMLRNAIFLEKVVGVTLKDYIIANSEVKDDHTSDVESIAESVGCCLAKMHNSDIIHGDLTTSNIIIEQVQCKKVVCLIDFGLSCVSSQAEDKGVDLYVFERALLSTHPGSENLFALLLNSYKKLSKNYESVIAKFDEVRQRGRKRTMVG